MDRREIIITEAENGYILESGISARNPDKTVICENTEVLKAEIEVICSKWKDKK